MQNSAQQLDYLHAQQASAWMEVLRDPSPEQRTAFVAWLKESPRNVREFLLMLATDQALDCLDAKRLHNIEALLKQIDRNVVPLAARSESKQRSQTNRPRFLKWVGLATGALAASVGGWILLSHTDSTWQEFETAKGEQRAFELDDGSVIHLNTDSRVALHFSKQARDVRLLQGEALFRVHHDTGRPFRVHTNDAVIQAIGTQFNVYSRADGTSIAVVEGRVSVTLEMRATSSPSTAALPSHSHTSGSTPKFAQNLASSRSLGANEEAQVDHAGLITVRAMSDVSDAVAWQQRRLVFRQQTLAHIVEDFNRYSRRQIRLEGASTKERIYSGVFDADDPESLALVLARDTDLAVEVSGQAIVVRSR